MEKIYYNKLCRDKIPDIIKSKGFECQTRVIDEDEYHREITRKVFEEASGVSNHDSQEVLVKQLADLVITLDAITKEFGVSEEALNEAVERSLEEKGGYEKRLYLSWSSDTDYSSRDHSHGFDD